jgi:hypothetical protein
MTIKNYVFQSDYAKKYIAIGREEGLVQALMTVLRRRGLEPDEDVRARLLATQDADLLQVWIERASTAESLAEVFED